MKFAVCYNGLDVFNSTKELMDFYKECALMSEGSEKERYTNILLGYIADLDREFALDGDGEDIWSIHFHNGDKVETIKVDRQNFKDAIKKVKAGMFKLPKGLKLDEAEKLKKEETLESLIAKIEDIGWWVSNGSKDGELELEIGMMSDAGEDFSFTATGKDLEELKQDIRNYCYGFDVDEHIKMWVEAQGSVAGVPDTRTLVHDAESLSEYLEDLGDRIYESVKNPSGKTAKDFLDYELEDDDSDEGGVSFAGETLRNFVAECDIPEDTPIEIVNKDLKDCGIKPININVGLKESVENNTDRTLAETMSLAVADLFTNMAEDLNTNDESLNNWLENGDSFYNSQKFTREELDTLTQMLQELSPKIDEVIRILKKYQK